MRTLCLCLLFLCSSQLRADEPMTADKYCSTMEAVFEVVLDNHIEPPARQQMVLALLRNLHQNESQLALAELAKTISDVSDKEALYGVMRQEIQRYATHLPLDSKRMNRVELNWLNGIVPGGVSLIDPKNAEVEQQLAANRYVGIGVQLTKSDDGYFFPKVMEKGTAARGGILSGDQLVKVNDVPVSGSIEDIVDQLRGPEGSQLRLTVQTHSEEPRDVELRRQVVLIDSVTLVPTETKDTATIQVQNIKASTVHELQTIIEHLPESVQEINLQLQFDGNFHHFVLFADALLDQCDLGDMITRGGRRPVKMTDGNVLEGRKLKLEFADRDQQLELLNYLTPHVKNQRKPPYFTKLQEVYLQESFPILDGSLFVSLATRKFVRGVEE